MGGWARLLIAGLVAGSVSDSHAEGPMPASASACQFEAAGAGKVSAIIDGRSFVLDDGREVRLAGIEVPFPPALGETGPRAIGCPRNAGVGLCAGCSPGGGPGLRRRALGPGTRRPASKTWPVGRTI